MRHISQLPPVKPSDAQRRIQTMRKAITAVDGQMASFDNIFDINGLFTWANEQIADKQLSDALWSIAVQLGVAMITGQVAGAIVAGGSQTSRTGTGGGGGGAAHQPMPARRACFIRHSI